MRHCSLSSRTLNADAVLYSPPTWTNAFTTFGGICATSTITTTGGTQNRILCSTSGSDGAGENPLLRSVVTFMGRFLNTIVFVKKSDILFCSTTVFIIYRIRD